MTDPTPTSHASTPRRPALDGLRAVAVVAVVLYHVDHDAIPGGFVGVDLFFVLSGYLITTLLVTERQRDGGVSLRRFWGRRIRRLWPLAWLTMGFVAAASLWNAWSPDRQRTLPAELTTAVAQVANWYQIGHGGYVRSSVAPSPVRHFWSLAIEEQFYVVWPLLLVAMLALPAVRRRRVVPVALGVVAGLSIGAGFLHAGSPDRAYLGTDVRIVAPVAGCALAWGLRAHPLRGPASRRGRVAAGILGPPAVVAFVVAVLTLHADSPLLPRGGFAVVALIGAAIVAFAMTPNVFAGAMSWRPLAYLGRISFAVYLVHWPMLVALGPGRSTVLRLAVALPGAIVVSAALHRLVERPMIARDVPRPWVATGTTALVGVSVVALVLSVPAGLTPTERVSASLRRVGDPGRSTTTTAPRPAPGVTTTTIVCPSAAATADAASDIAESENAVVDPTAAACTGQLEVLVVGDSTGRGAANGLSKLGDPRLVVWDRTRLGCSFGGESCPDWRTAWQHAVDEIDPDVVLLYGGVVPDFKDVDDEDFLSDAEGRVRAEQFDDAIDILSSGGAKVMMVAPAVPLRPNGLFFCDGKANDSACDPDWVRRWTEDLRAAADARGVTVVDVAGWTAARGSTGADRPDGVHYSRAALQDQAKWLVPKIVATARSRPAPPS